MPAQQYDVAVIGAGVVGCAMARRFTLDGARVLVLEKAADVLDGASKANSAILHTGFDAPEDSVEQQCVAQGYAEYQTLAQELDLPLLNCGALVLSWDRQQSARLPELISKAQANGVDDVRMLTKAEILRREPGLSDAVTGGFEVPGESLIDPWTSAHAYLLQALANGAKLQRQTEVLSGVFDSDEWCLETSRESVSASYIINCAGLYGDELDQRLLGEQTFTIAPRKGQFVVFDKAASALASSIILPVPTQLTKGVVICRTVFGNLLLGPTAEPQHSRTEARTDRQTLQNLIDKGTRMLPALATAEITACYAGLRPATEFADYQIRCRPELHYATVGGIRSTGLSSALGIARHVAAQFAASACSGPAIARPQKPELDRLSDYHRRDWQQPDCGDIVCHCERVTRREIEHVLAGPMPPATLQGLKRRTRVTMGSCQGFYCGAELAKMTRGRFTPALADD